MPLSPGVSGTLQSSWNVRLGTSHKMLFCLMRFHLCKEPSLVVARDALCGFTSELVGVVIKLKRTGSRLLDGSFGCDRHMFN
jgi:hypothetical protein